MSKDKASDGDTSTIRKAITEKTPVVIPLGAIIIGVMSLIGLAGSWALWMTASVQQLKEDMAQVKAAVTHTEGVASK